MIQKTRKALAVGWGTALLCTLVASNAARATSDAFDPLNIKTGGPGNVVEYVVEGGTAEKSPYIGIQPTNANGNQSWKWCTGLDDPICDPKNNPVGMKATSILPPCTSSTQENCLDSVEIGTPNNLSKADLSRVISGLTFPANPSYNYLGSSNISLWNVPGVASSGGQSTYAVMPRIQSYFRDGRFYLGELFVNVIPYREALDPKYKAQKIDTTAPSTPMYPYTYSRYQQICVYEEDGKCGIAQDFPSDTRIKIKIRVTKELGGWFQGRLRDPVMDVQNFSINNNVVTVEASAVTVPRMALLTNQANFSDFEKTEYAKMGYWPTADDGNGSGAQAGIPADVFPFLEYYRLKVKDTALATNTFWNFSTTSPGNGSSCLQDSSKLLGIVSTNSMAYDGTAPSFSNGSLDYHVSGLHYMPDGTTPVQGTYNLVMRSDVARCLYGFSSAPIKATISIAGASDGPVATTLSGETNGWLSLAAAGFTFSQKNIQVKLTQDAPTPKKTTITCIKGKLTKSVSAVKPTCPTGYKKK